MYVYCKYTYMFNFLYHPTVLGYPAEHTDFQNAENVRETRRQTNTQRDRKPVVGMRAIKCATERWPIVLIWST